jgi:hypothetical protein
MAWVAEDGEGAGRDLGLPPALRRARRVYTMSGEQNRSAMRTRPVEARAVRNSTEAAWPARMSLELDGTSSRSASSDGGRELAEL